MKKYLKLISVILAVILVIGCFAGCKNKGVVGSSSVMTKSEVDTTSDYIDDEKGSVVDTVSETEGTNSEKEQDSIADNTSSPNNDVVEK